MTKEEQKTISNASKDVKQDAEFWKGAPKKEEDEMPQTIEMDDKEMGTMKLKSPKPIFKDPTKCKIVDIKFYKLEENEVDKKGNEYIPFFATLDFEESEGEKREFKETYRGGRFYENDGKTSIYIGKISAIGKFKIVCVENDIDPGANIKTWAEAVVGKEVLVKSGIVQFAGKDYDKNFVVSFVK